jgi:hypothetical protein
VMAVRPHRCVVPCHDRPPSGVRDSLGHTTERKAQRTAPLIRARPLPITNLFALVIIGRRRSIADLASPGCISYQMRSGFRLNGGSRPEATKSISFRIRCGILDSIHKMQDQSRFQIVSAFDVMLHAACNSRSMCTASNCSGNHAHQIPLFSIRSLTRAYTVLFGHLVIACSGDTVRRQKRTVSV